MVFIPRDPVVQNQFLTHDSTWAATATAGAVVQLSGDELVAVVSGTPSGDPYGFLMQNVRAESSAHPTGFRLPGDLGSSDAFTGDPVGVAHLGIYDTTHYDTTATYTAGDVLETGADGTVTSDTAGGGGTAVDATEVAVCQNSLDADAVSAGQNLRIKLLI
jgi:hypothetical protein